MRSVAISAAISIAILVALSAGIFGCKRADPSERNRKVLHLALRAKPSTLDPVKGGGQEINKTVMGAVYESLLEYKYLARPYELTPLLLERMPELSEDGTTYTFTLRRGVFFQDDPAFARTGGRGREVNASDVIYSIQRMANAELEPTGWWVYADRIRGFDEYKEKQGQREHGAPFDVTKAVEGLETLGSHSFRIHLLRPYPQLLYVLATPYSAIVPPEAVEYYGADFGQHPVGTGPFKLTEIVLGLEYVFTRNPNYREAPFLDGIVMHVYEQDQPMWLKWRVGDLDFIQVPSEYQDALFDEKGATRHTFVAEGIGRYDDRILDFIYRGFNMEDPIVGGFGRGKFVRQAISLALDTNEIADAFYNNTVELYDGPIPPGLDGYTAGVISPYRGPNLAKAKELLTLAGYPNGEGLPPIEFHTNRGGNSREQIEMFARQLARIGVRISATFHSFPELDDQLRKRKAQMFGLAWFSDYPDAENNLALFYGPNSAPGSNNFNYRNKTYDALYEKARVMPPSAERTVLYQKMRDIVIEDCPAIGSMARIRFYAWNRRVRGLKPSETWYTWIKYVDVTPREN